MSTLRLSFLIFLILPIYALAESKICPEVSGYECLVKNSRKLYDEDYKQWFKIYDYQSEKASSCADEKEVTLFLRLWSSWTDGETAEILFATTEDILIKNHQCFFNGILGLKPQEKTSLISRFCPMQNPGLAKKSVTLAIKNPRYKSVATELLQQFESEQCKNSG